MQTLWLSELELVGFRSHEHSHFRFAPKFNGLVGDNGRGKTNVLDSIYYLCLGKSYFSSSDRQAVRIDGDFFLVKGSFVRFDRAEEVELAYAPADRKQIKRNGKALDRLSDHLGNFPSVVIAPRDQELVDGPAEERRKFADQVIAQSDKSYLEALIRYRQLLKQRNALLKSAQGRDPGEALSFYDYGLSISAEILVDARSKMVAEIVPLLEQFADQIGGGESASMVYRPDVERDLEAVLAAGRSTDLRFGHTRRGIHKDDFEWTLRGKSLRDYGSQGQQKSYLLALKLAQYAFMRSKLDLTPILLLDDLFDKLDIKRAKGLIELLRTSEFGQVFVTDTHPERVEALFEGLNEGAMVHSLNNNSL